MITKGEKAERFAQCRCVLSAILISIEPFSEEGLPRDPEVETLGELRREYDDG